MFEQMISIPTTDAVNRFHKGICKVDCDVDLVTQNFRYIIDAKSIMGIYSLDLSRPVILKAHTDDAAVIAQIKDVLENL